MFCIAAVGLAVVASSVAAAQPTTVPTTQPAELNGLLEAYFAEPKSTERRALARDIDELIEGDVEMLAAALDQLQIWPEVEAGTITFPLQRGRNRVTMVHVRVPEGYDATKRYPLILGLHGKGGRAEDILYYIQGVLGPDVDDFIIAAPTDYKGTWFDAPLEETEDPVALLLEVRKRYHLDTNRTYALGYSMGGHSSWLLAIMYSDYFAAAVPLAGTFVVPFAAQCYALLLPNIDKVPVLAVWGENDVGDEKRDTAPGGGIATHNRLLLRTSAQCNVPLNGVELKGVGHAGVVPPKDLLATFLEYRRDPYPQQVHHYFRFPAQARISWLRQRKFSGRPWQGSQIAISVTSRVDVDEYITGVLKEKLGLLGGVIEGQYIEAEVTHTAELEVLLSDELVNLAEPITLKVGDKIRFEGKVEPKVETMLEVAHEDWDFQRLYSVRLIMRAQSKARQD